MKDYPAHTPSYRPFLVAVGDSHVLVDASNGRLLVINEEGARFWRALGDGAQAQTAAERTFLDEVRQQELARVPREEGDGPRVIACAPLQVAANTSDPNPFSADSGW